LEFIALHKALIALDNDHFLRETLTVANTEQNKDLSLEAHQEMVSEISLA